MKIVHNKDFGNKAYIDITITQQYHNGVESTNKALENLGVKIKEEDGVIKVYER
jgi:ACT domain-containing protein